MRELPEDRPPTDEDLRLLLADYMLVEAESAEDRETHSLAFADLSFLVQEDPEATWRFIKIAADAKLSMHMAGYIAASVLEDLLGHHGRLALKWIGDEAPRNPGLQLMLGMVWRGSMDGETWRRFEALRDDLKVVRM